MRLTQFAPRRSVFVLLLVLALGLLAGCGDEVDMREESELPRAASSPSTADASPTRSGIPTPPIAPSKTAAPPAVQAALSAPIVVPLDPNGADQYKLHLLDSDGAPPRRLTPEGSEIVGSESAPDWSPDGQRIVFVGYVGDGVDLFTIDADGTALRNLTNVAGHVTQPRWSPDGSRIVYVRSDSDSTEIHVMNADGSDSRQLTSGMGHEDNPVWSPDGEWIAFFRTVFVEATPSPDREATEAAGEDDDSAGSQAAEGEFQTTICVMRPDGSDQRVLATVHFAEALQWSPDGQQLAFSTYSSFRENQHAQVVGADGAGQRALDNGTVASSLPRWSPDGSRLSVVMTDPGGSAQSIVVMNVDGTEMRSIAPVAGWHAWSPDGSQIVVAQGRVTLDGSPTGRSNLYVIGVDDAEPGQRLLLEDAALGGNPAWSPAR